MTIPKHHSVFLSTQPRSSSFSLSRGYLLSLQYKVPTNLSSLLFGGSQMTSPEEQSKCTPMFYQYLSSVQEKIQRHAFTQQNANNHSEDCQKSTCPRAESLRCPHVKTNIINIISPSKSISFVISPKSEVTVKA